MYILYMCAMCRVALLWCLLDHDSHEFILECGTVANIYVMENVVSPASRLRHTDTNIHMLQSRAATKLSHVRGTTDPAGLRKTTLSHSISVLGCDNYHVTVIKLACWIHKILKMCSELWNLADNGCWQYGMVSLLCNHQPVQMSMSAEIAEFYPCSACFCTVLYNQILSKYHTVLSSAGKAWFSISHLSS